MLNWQYLTIGSIFSNSLPIRPSQTVAQRAIKKVPNIVSLSHCLEQLYSCIFNSYVKACLYIWWRRMYGSKLFLFTFCRRVYRCVLDNWQLCLVRVYSLITRLQLKKMSVIYQSAHVAITFQLLGMSSITIPNQTTSNIRTTCQGTSFSRKNISDLTAYGTILAVIGFISPIISLEYWPLPQLTCWKLWHELHRIVCNPLNKLLITNLLLSCHYFISYQKKI